jgi:hypothetical protein
MVVKKTVRWVSFMYCWRRKSKSTVQMDWVPAWARRASRVGGGEGGEEDDDEAAAAAVAV